MKTNINKEKILPYIFTLASMLLLLPHIFRSIYFRSELIGEQSYLHLTIAESLQGNVTIYHFLLHTLSLFFPIYTLSKVVPFILGLGSLFFFYRLLKRFIANDEQIFFILLATVLSPVFLYTFTTSTPHALTIFLIFLGLDLFIQEGKLSFLSIIFFALASSSIFIAVIIALLLGMYHVFVKKKSLSLFLNYGVMIFVNLFFHNPFFVSFIYTEKTFLLLLFSDFGGSFGFGIFTVILFLIGLGAYIRPLKFLLYPLILFFLASLFITAETILYLQFFVALFAGLGLYRLISVEWNMSSMKTAVVIVLFCGLLFSVLSHISRLSTAEPTPELIASLEWLKTQPKGNVLSHYSNGFVIEEKTHFSPFVDSLSVQRSQKLLLMNALFHSRNLPAAQITLRNQNISYILIDERMRQGLVWNEFDDGLLFLLHNKKVFSKVYDNEKIQIYFYESNETKQLSKK